MSEEQVTETVSESVSTEQPVQEQRPEWLPEKFNDSADLGKHIKLWNLNLVKKKMT